MATIVMDGDSTISFGGIDLSGAVSSIELPIDDDEAGWATARLARLEDLSLTFSGHWEGPMPLLDLPAERTITVTLPERLARAWVAYVRQLRRARIRRMHLAYRRRHGRGRW